MAPSLEMGGPYLGKHGLFCAHFLVNCFKKLPTVANRVHLMQTGCKYGVDRFSDSPCASARNYCSESSRRVAFRSGILNNDDHLI
jgi:hypothetical protein